MAEIIPNADLICSDLVPGPDELFVELAGARIFATAGFEAGSTAAITRSFLGNINSSLAPLTPIFDIMDLLNALVQAVEAVPGILGPPPNPGKLIALLPEIGKKLEKIASQFPIVTVPIAVWTIVNALIVSMQGLRDEMTALVALQERIVTAELRAQKLGNVGLQLAVQCERDNLVIDLQNLNSSVKPIARLVQSANVLLHLIGQPCIAVPLDAIGAIEAEALKPIDKAIELLTLIRDSIPIIRPQLGAVPLSTDPC